MPASKNFVRYNTLPPPSFDNSINFTVLGVTYTLGDFDESTKNSTKKPKKGFYRPKMTLYKTFSTSLFIPFLKLESCFTSRYLKCIDQV